MIDQNNLAQRIAVREGGIREVDIAQTKEVLRITLEELAKERPSEVLALVERHKS